MTLTKCADIYELLRRRGATEVDEEMLDIRMAKAYRGYESHTT